MPTERRIVRDVIRSCVEHRAVLGAGVALFAALFAWMARNRFEQAPVSTASIAEPIGQMERKSLDESPSLRAAPDLDLRQSIDGPVVPSLVGQQKRILIVRGQVFDVHGNGVVGARLRQLGHPEQALGTSGTDGKFELSVKDPQAHFVIDVDDDKWAMVRSASVYGHAQNPVNAVLVVAPAIEVSGVVVTGDGVGISTAHVSIPLYKELLAGCPVPFDSTIAVDVVIDTDAVGRFALKHVPGVRGSFLCVNAPGFHSKYFKLEGTSDSNLVISLEADEQGEQEIEGIVLQPNGGPADNTSIHLWNSSATTDDEGRFRLDRPGWLPEQAALVASREGVQPAIWHKFGAFVMTATDSEVRSLILVLGPPALIIEGYVLDGRGGKLSGWIVSIVDGTEVGDERRTQLFAEQLAASKPNSVTDADGRFRITGLLPRPYMLLAYDPRSLQSVRGGPFDAGRQDADLIADVGAVYSHVAGRVVSRKNAAVAGVRTVLSFVTKQEPSGKKQWIRGASTTTDDAGEFSFTNVPRSGVHLDVFGDAIMPQSFEIAPSVDAERLSLSVALRCHFSVTTDGTLPAASSIEVLDENGLPLDIFVFEANVWQSSSKQAINEVGSGVLAVSEDARALRVLAGGQESASTLAQTSLSLDPHTVTPVFVSLAPGKR
jgi:hypothetical protein